MPDVERCTTCGHPVDPHPYRHPITRMTRPAERFKPGAVTRRAAKLITDTSSAEAS